MPGQADVSPMPVLLRRANNAAVLPTHSRRRGSCLAPGVAGGLRFASGWRHPAIPLPGGSAATRGIGQCSSSSERAAALLVRSERPARRGERGIFDDTPCITPTGRIVIGTARWVAW